MKDPAATLQSAFMFHQQGMLARAEELYTSVLRLQPANFDAIFLLATAYAQQNRFEEALGMFERAHKLKPRHPETLNNRGNVLLELRRYEEALASYEQSLTIRPGDIETFTNRGVALQKLNRFEEALSSFDNALAIRRDHAEAWNNRGVTLQELERYDEALSSIDRAIAIRKYYAEAWNNRGNVLKALMLLEEASASYKNAVLYKSDYMDAHLNLVDTLMKRRFFHQALICIDKVIEQYPGYFQAYTKRAALLRELNRHVDALSSYEEAFSLQPDCQYLFGQVINSRMLICEWRGFKESKIKVEQKILSGEKAVIPFHLLLLMDSPVLQKLVSEGYGSVKYPPDKSFSVITKRKRKEKIRIGYFSPDFRKHPMSLLTAEMYELHDRDRFEISAFSFSPMGNDEIRERVAAAFDRFIDVRTISDRKVVEMSRAQEIDIAVDLCGYMNFCRTGIFALQAAPVQVNYLGFPGTLGISYFDYIVADPVLIPERNRQFYTEKIAYLPFCYMAHDSKQLIAERLFSRTELGLPETGFVFCCFNHNAKLTPEVFDSWMVILGKVEGSVLWLLEDVSASSDNLRREALFRGIDPERLIFAPRFSSNAEHLARHRRADLLIDTLPCNAHTTAMDALWTGLPLVTLIGESFASRVAASLLSAVGLQELIATSREEYEALAVELAMNPEKLRLVREKLERNRWTTPLFDSVRFTKHMESAFETMYERYLADLPPDHIFVNP
ncbi:MAG: tetratricopeptide repeat protein [Chlorobiaceae bacterium]|nr:tetratricopeptide repeat protein [Chlorobiaceae bacterium]